VANSTEQLTITEKIDLDDGLRSKRKLLTIVSLILLALSFSGAKVEGANTFILTLSFENQQGISVLLVLAIMFLLVRYYNYACKHHFLLYKLWTARLCQHPFFLRTHPHEPDVSGLVSVRAPEGFDPEDCRHSNEEWGFSYKCQFPFVRKIQYWTKDQYDIHEAEARVGRKNYFKVLWLEARFQCAAFLTHREHLDILSPYILGTSAILSYAFNDYFQAAVKTLVAN
jgi:hypothetical protein